AAMSHGRCQLAEIELAADADGKITGLRLDVTGDAGAYPAGLDMPPITTMMSVGCYAIPNVDLKAKAVYTNTSAIGAYRGAGRPEAAYYIERAVDILAHKMGKDAAELRRINFIQPEQFPYKTPAGFTYDTGEYEKALDKALEVSNYTQLRAEQAKAREEGRLVGIGLASYVEICGFGPWESSSIRIDPSGAVSIFTGISPHGQGQETTFAQMVADELGADFDRIVVHHGDTSNTPQGNGTMGSRGLAVGGAAVMASAVKIRDKMLAIAGHQLEVAKDDVEYDRETGTYRVKGSPDRSLTLNEIAEIAYGGSLPEDIDAGLVTTDFFKTTGETYPFGTHVAMVEIDPETGKVEVKNFWSVDDCGNVISPILVEGQVHGGLAQGIGQALYEESVYDENGQLITSTLMEYAVPHADSFPMFELHRTVTPTPLNPMGAKGIGEAATIGSTPATVNAVLDALAPHGVTHLDMPLSAPKVWAALQGGGE
ncbi:MAG TPA: molybdopterin cofactor-binding domain-containing protein, partial [Thermomicrobiales bacterium]|nr:molybdopterin cofactor-binding domain-containing protein [Thermomicrobiales bacterium]